MQWVKQYFQQYFQQCSQHNKMQRGSAMIEFCIAMLPVMMLGSLILEVTYWHTARQRLALAVSQAVDLAAMQHGAEAVAWQHLKQKRPELHIQLHDVQPTSETIAIFSDFTDPALSQQFGQPTIRHDFLMAQHEKYKSRGWISGRGPLSGQTILEANTLSLTVTGWHKPYLSWLGSVMRLWQGHNHIAIRVTQSALMQSHRFKNKSSQLSIQPYVSKAWQNKDHASQMCVDDELVKYE
jgi:hypothetical protein